MVANEQIMEHHNMKDENTKKIKNIYSIDVAIIDHFKTNMDKVIQNNNMIDESEMGMVTVDYEMDILEGDIFTEKRIKKIMYLLSNYQNAKNIQMGGNRIQDYYILYKKNKSKYLNLYH
jgi:hypothetical protein